MKTMYPAQTNSPGTELAMAVDDVQSVIQVVDGSILPAAPNLLTIGTDEAAETIMYTGKSGNELTNVTRGFQGTAQSWVAGTKVARYFTAYDHNSTVDNIEKLSYGVNGLSSRLDTEHRKDVVLSAGVQILNAEREAPFSLSSIKGQMLVNLLGRAGRFTDLSEVSSYGNHSASLSSNYRVDGDNSLKIVTTGAGGSNNFVRVTDTAFEDGSNYIIMLNAKADTSTQLHGELYGTRGNVLNCDITASWKTVVLRCVGRDGGGGLHLWNNNATSNILYLDGIRIYKVSNDDYVAPDAYLIAKYPYVDSAQPVKNPYAIRYGKNLLPPFYEWSTYGSGCTVVTPYTGVIKATAINFAFGYKIPCVPNEIYTFSAQHNGAMALQTMDEKGALLNNSGYQLTQKLSVTTTASDKFIHVLLGNASLGNGDYKFNSPMLTIGTEDQPFKSREDAMLALQTDLYADPVTGESADELFEKDGQYYKLAKWKNVVMDGQLAWAFSSSETGHKVVYFHLAAPYNPATWNPTGVKFDGQILKRVATGPDKLNGSTSDTKLILISVSNSDSGWGDNYTPTAGEIKAYFMGWKMFDASTFTGVEAAAIYNGTGTKRWVKQKIKTQASNVLPVSSYFEWTPYQLVYQLATPSAEPVIFEGMVTFHEGDNQIEVGTGIVLRESVKPFKSPVSPNFYYLHSRGAGVRLAYDVGKIMALYKNNKPDRTWNVYNSDYSLDYGVQNAELRAEFNDVSAAYSASYLMLNKSPIVPFMGTCAANEKAMFQDLTDAIQQNAAAVSVLMNIKADKEAPGWIVPTLLNGWVYFGGGATPAYFKDNNGFVHLRGRLKAGAIASVMFVLPKGYRPAQPLFLVARAYTSTNTTTTCVIDTDGIVYVTDYNSEINIDGLTFLADQ
ncbi:hypothetical protein JJQ72_02300 [Paenibacillus sp. F411]|uniref:hypothetical protein n=1 Tax=Paenibacillus sp. F411 TaxID=2820239 RepID=UPI001AAF4A03|nr:hypothetical protein [Paenibacillus sp. F411]MBO2942816.1 hypothetical protein [Paenibacillus sp. F411]